MNPEISPAPEIPAQTGEPAACAYITAELPKARRALKRTRIICIALLLLVGAYIGVITMYLVGFCEPKEAAQVASGMLTRHAADHGPALAAQIEREIPALLRQMPDYVIRQIPVLRQNLQRSLETEFRSYCVTFSSKLGAQMDALIEDHQAEVKTLLENAGDRAAIRKTLPQLDHLIAQFTQKDSDGRALKKHIDEVAAALQQAEKRMDRLANGTDLTPEELKARRALALLARAIEENTLMPARVSLAPTQTRR